MPAQTIVSVVKDSAGAAIPEIGSLPQGSPAAQAATETAMVTAARITTLSAAGIILLGLLATIALPAMRREDECTTEAAPVAVQLLSPALSELQDAGSPNATYWPAFGELGGLDLSLPGGA